MRLTCKVDQAAALARGIDAPHSTVSLEIDPALLTAPERDLAAALLTEGHLLTERGVLEVGTDGKVTAQSGCPRERNIVLSDPRVDGLRDELARLIGVVADMVTEAQYRADTEALAEADQRRINHECRAAIERLGTEEQKQRLSRGYMGADIIQREGMALLTDEAFAPCPLPGLRYPSASDIDVSDWGGGDLPEIQLEVGSVPDEYITDQLMARITLAEAAMSMAVDSAEPYRYGITRDDDSIPWEHAYGLRLTVVHHGIVCVRDVAI